MLINKKTSEKLLEELNVRHASLYAVLAGRQADERDQYDCARGSNWTQNKLEKSVAVDSYKLRLAVADFKTILAEIGRLK